jgi:HTH-type transcriptional regulator/antitoxin HigA
MQVTVAALIQAELDRRAWIQADLARVLGWPVQTLSEVMQGKRRIDAGMALDVAAVSEVEPHEWLAAQAAQDLRQARQAPDVTTRRDEITRRAELEDVVPVRELIKRGVITATDPGHQLEEVKALLEVAAIRDDPPYFVSAKRVRDGVPLSRAQKAWIALARRRARAIEAPPYDEAAFRLLAQDLPREVREPRDLEGLPDRFAGTGVRLVHIPAFPGGRIDGVSMELESSPMIALSGRGKRIDRVLFALLHESAHVVSGHWSTGVLRVHEGGAVGDPEIEAAVNSLAQSWILPDGLGPGGPFNAAGIEAISRRSGVSRAVIIGQLQHMGAIPWASVVARGLPNVEEALMSWR